MPVRTILGFLIVVLLIAAGCRRSDSTSGDDELSDTDDDELPDKEQLVENRPTEGYEDISQDIEHLLSVSPFHPESIATSVPYRVGVLVIEEPCVYVELAVGNISQSPLEVRHTAEGEPLRTFMRFPKSVTRYNKTTQQIWMNNAGPMTSGDEVILSGNVSPHLDWATRVFDEECVANAVVFVRSMQPWPVIAEQTDSNFHMENPDFTPSEDDIEKYRQGDWIVGVLVYTGPCLYLEFAHHKEDVSLGDSDRVRTVLNLLRVPDLYVHIGTVVAGNNERSRMDTRDEVLVVGNIFDDNRPRTEKIYDGLYGWEDRPVKDACVAHSQTKAQWIEPYSLASQYLHLPNARP